MSAEVVYLIEATVYDPALPGTRVLRYCSGGGYVHEGNYYEPRIKHPGRLKRALFGEGKTSGPSQIGYGEVVLVNNDGGLDALSTYGFDGRTLMIKRALAVGAVLSGVIILAACSMEQPTATWDELAIRVKDRQQELNVPLQASKYGGTNALPNGVDGTADIQGKPLPLLFGVVKNATPVCVNSARLIYQLHDGALAAVDTVYDKGVPLAAGTAYASQAEMEASAPVPGQYRAWAGGGMFRLGAAPAGLVTADATEGASTADRSAAKLVARIAARAVAAGDVSAADVAALHGLNTAEVGYYSATETTVAAALDAVIGSVGGWYGFDTPGQLRLGRLDAPSGSPVATLTEAENLSIERLPTNDAGRGLPVWSVLVEHTRNWSPAATGWADRQLLAPWRKITRTNGRGCSIAFGNGIYVLLNEASLGGSPTNSYLTSTDGVTWTPRTLPTSKEWSAVCFANGKFVAISDFTSAVILTSDDGINWLWSSPAPNNGRAVAGGNGIFVALFSGTDYRTSTDGITWTARTMPASGWASLYYGNGLFIASNGGAGIYTSPDGIAWTSRALPGVLPASTLGWASFAYGNGYWVGVSSEGPVIRSADGVNWDVVWAIPQALSRNLVFADGRFYAISVGNVSSSADGSVWVAAPFPLAAENFLPFTRFASATGAGTVVVIPKQLSATAAVFDLAEGAARAAWLPAKSLTASAKDSGVLVIHPLARELSVDTLLVSAAAAQAEAARLLALHSVDRVRLRVKVPRSLLPVDLLGQPLLLQIPRYGYDAGKLLLVIGIEEDCGADTLQLDLWG